MTSATARVQFTHRGRPRLSAPATIMRTGRIRWRNGKSRISTWLTRTMRATASRSSPISTSSKPPSWRRSRARRIRRASCASRRCRSNSTAADGARLALLRVEVDAVTDVGSVMPHLGGKTFRYDPLPAALVARRRRLRFVYGDGSALRALTFAQVRALMQA